MAGKPKLKAALAALDRRGGPEALQQELLAGKTIPMIAKDSVSAGSSIPWRSVDRTRFSRAFARGRAESPRTYLPFPVLMGSILNLRRRRSVGLSSRTGRKAFLSLLVRIRPPAPCFAAVMREDPNSRPMPGLCGEPLFGRRAMSVLWCCLTL